jgi:hypothetical protein
MGVGGSQEEVGESQEDKRTRKRPREEAVHCSLCGAHIADGGRCAKCRNAARREQRKEPLEQIYRRWYSMSRKRWPDAAESRKRALVQVVWQRCNQRSVVSGETDVRLLCIAPRGDVPVANADELVVLTKDEAKRARAMSAEERAVFLAPRQ